MRFITANHDLIGPWVAERTGGTWCTGRGTALGLIQDNEIRAGVLYEDWNGQNIVVHIAGLKHWATREYLRVIFDYPFNQLKATRMTAPINDDNAKSIGLVERLGFTLEASLQKATPTGNLLIYRLFKDDCRFLKAPYGQKFSTSGT